MGATRNVALSELNFRGLSINPVNTNSVTVVASDSGVIFLNKNTAATTNYVLPAVADAAGKMFWFFNANQSANTLITFPTNTLIADNSIIGNTMTTTANNAGAGAFVVCDGTNYFMFDVSSSAWSIG